MTSMNSLEENSKTQLSRSKEILTFIPTALERVGSELSQEKSVSMSLDVANEFSNIKIETIKSAIKKGALGEFGQTYKLTTQEVCIWIRKEILYRNTHDSSGRQKLTF